MIFTTALFGVFVWNFPKGLIFLGDAGAYISGLMLGALGMLMVERNEGVTPLVLLVIFAYPITELLFSFYRKTIRSGHGPDRPDKVHFHMLMYRRLGRRLASSNVARNSATGALMNMFSLSGLLYILVVPITRGTAVLYFLVFVIVYMRLYRKLSLN